jgi:hypothetical protein
MEYPFAKNYSFFDLVLHRRVAATDFELIMYCPRINQDGYCVGAYHEKRFTSSFNVVDRYNEYFEQCAKEAVNGIDAEAEAISGVVDWIINEMKTFHAKS